MFLTGEFAKIARISKRMLQYYDAIGLFKPEHTDPQTGYRYYSARQLPRLNRVLALKDLGLSLEQITQVLEEGIDDDEIQAMLARQKSELETRILEDLQRLRRIESRLKQPVHDLPDVVLKTIEPQRFLSVDHFCRNPEDGIQFGGLLLQQITRVIPERNIERLIILSDSDDFISENVNLEYGFIVREDVPDEVDLGDGLTLTTRILEGVEHMASVAHVGDPRSSHVAYGVLANWIEVHGYRMAGYPRDTLLEIPKSPDQDFVMEIQIPVTPQSTQSLTEFEA